MVVVTHVRYVSSLVTNFASIKKDTEGSSSLIYRKEFVGISFVSFPSTLSTIITFKDT